MTSPLPVMFRRADLVAAGVDDRTFRQARRRGALVTVAPGHFVQKAAWDALSRHDRYRVRVRARLSRLAPHLVASHDSAAVLWGMPCLDSWPDDIHVVDHRIDHPTRKSGLVRHAGPLGEDEITAGRATRATSALRTAIDLALRDGFVTALMLFDHCLRRRLFTLEEAAAALSDRASARRIRAATQALGFASPLAESAGESISRAQIILLGFEPPELQRRFFDGGREVARVDFFWQGVGVVGEFDGDEKYIDGAMRSGRSIERVMLDEKWRSEALLDLPEVNRVVRWNYTTARDAAALAERLLRAGVPRLSRRRGRGLTLPAHPARSEGQNEPER